MKDIKHTPVCPSIPAIERIILLRNAKTGDWKHLRVSRLATDADIQTILKNNIDHKFIGDFNHWLESGACANEIEEEEIRKKKAEPKYHNHQHVFED